MDQQETECSLFRRKQKKKKIVSSSKFLDFTPLKDHPNSFIEIKML